MSKAKTIQWHERNMSCFSATESVRASGQLVCAGLESLAKERKCVQGEVSGKRTRRNGWRHIGRSVSTSWAFLQSWTQAPPGALVLPSFPSANTPPSTSLSWEPCPPGLHMITDSCYAILSSDNLAQYPLLRVFYLGILRPGNASVRRNDLLTAEC